MPGSIALSSSILLLLAVSLTPTRRQVGHELGARKPWPSDTFRMISTTA